MIRLTLPFPPSELRPNRARTRHWASNAKVAAQYKADCLMLCRAGGLRKLDGVTRLHLSLRFCPPDQRRRDVDGTLSACKPLLDSIAQITGIDDYYFSLELHRGEVVRGGVVEVMVTEGE